MDSPRKSALITGGAVRLGRFLSLSLARLGYDVALHYNSSEEAAHATRDEIRAMGRSCELFRFDLADSASPARLIAAAGEWASEGDLRYELQVLVNSASVYDQARLLDTDAALLEKQFRVNFQAPFLLIREFAKFVSKVPFRQTAAARSSYRRSPSDAAPASIVNIIDNKIAFNQNEYAAYLLSKKALAELTRMAALELAPGVRVNGIAPGVILPAETRSEEYIAWRARGIPLGRQGRLDEIGAALEYLLGNAFVTGQILMVDGGESLTNTGRNAAAFSEADGAP